MLGRAGQTEDSVILGFGKTAQDLDSSRKGVFLRLLDAELTAYVCEALAPSGASLL